jgi:uncharacterized protein YlxW (UPF0749 family)
MDLLNDIMRNPIDPEYWTVAARGGSARASRAATLLVTVVIGALFAYSAVQTTRSAPATQEVRDQLIVRIKTEDERHDSLRADVETLRAENDRARTAALARDEGAQATQAELARLGPITGDLPVRGPGVTIVVDDAPVVRDDKLNRVLDRDLQLLVNGLWYAGAEAIAINGHRLSALTAIRNAGDAITVDYRSLTRPYRIEAIGDPKTLAARFADSSGGQLWQGLQQNYRMPFDLRQTEQLELRADPGLGVKHARRAT